jgi:hypothetical protein
MGDSGFGCGFWSTVMSFWGLGCGNRTSVV